MTEPRTHREANIARKGLEDRVALLQRLLWTVITFLGAIIAGGFAISFQIGDVKTDVAGVKITVAGINDRLGKMEKVIDDIRADGGQILSRISRLEPPPRPPAPDPRSNVVAGFSVTDGEARSLRELLGAPQKADAPSTIALWQRLPEQALRPMPDDVANKLPKFKDLRYAIDPGNNIALVEPSGMVVAII